jgi:DNA mismatch repair protein MutS
MSAARSALETPMMRQFLAIKANHPDAVLFYRMGDFYEMFLEDAERCAPLLDLTLTTRDKGKPDAVAMCGVPVHSAASYIARLSELGVRVAVCEQVEDPKAAGRRLVRREVVEVVTPGLIGDPEGLAAHLEVSLVALARDPSGSHCGLAVFESSTGRFRATEVSVRDAPVPRGLVDELARIAPREIAVARSERGRFESALAAELPDVSWTEVDDEVFALGSDPVLPKTPDGFSAEGERASMRAAAAVIRLVGRLQPGALHQIVRLQPYRLADTMVLDPATCGHLELFENSEDRGLRGTLFERIDRSTTPLGARRLAQWLRYPLLDRRAILERQSRVRELAERDPRRASLRAALAAVGDLERRLAKPVRPQSGPRDLAALRASLQAMPGVDRALRDGSNPVLETLLQSPPDLAPVEALLTRALVDDPPLVPKGSRGALQTGYIREGYHGELDGLRESATKGREWIAGLEAEERARSGIATLKVRFHPVHGYALEVSKSQLDKVPEDYERKQTLANAERFTTPALLEMEGRVRGAQERAAALEREIFDALRAEVASCSGLLLAAAEVVAELDALAALAETAREDAWVAPEIYEDGRLEISAGRHPVVASVLRSRDDSAYVPNDTELPAEDPRMLLLTGPNMSGKSTYLRQVALIVLLAQIGSYVPAEAAEVGLVDRVFTRVGASDRLARGESTFMVEMRETADILAEASDRSLLILDEIGRGTSTFDGLAIAWAVVEYLHDTPGLRPRTLFATHYHELAALASHRAGLRNMHFQVKEWEGRVIFLRRLVPGEASRSYGIQVAELAGLPSSIVARARERLADLEAERAARGDTDGGQLELWRAPDEPRATAGPDQPAAQPAAGSSDAGSSAPAGQPAAGSAVLEALRVLDIETLTPLEALNALDRLARDARRGSE